MAGTKMKVAAPVLAAPPPAKLRSMFASSAEALLANR